MAGNWIPISDGELELLECDSKRGSPMARLLADLRRTREALREAREDTYRLNWLENRKYFCAGINHHDGRWVHQIEAEGSAFRGPNMRAAIDDGRIPVQPKPRPEAEPRG